MDNRGRLIINTSGCNMSVDWCIDWLIDWSIGCLIDWCIDWCIDLLIDCCIDWLGTMWCDVGAAETEARHGHRETSKKTSWDVAASLVQECRWKQFWHSWQFCFQRSSIAEPRAVNQPERTGMVFQLEFLLLERHSGLVVTSKLASRPNSLTQHHSALPNNAGKALLSFFEKL